MLFTLVALWGCYNFDKRELQQKGHTKTKKKPNIITFLEQRHGLYRPEYNKRVIEFFYL